MQRVFFILVLLLFYASSASAFDLEFENSIKKSEVTVDDLLSFLDIDYKKYKVLVKSETDVFVVFRDIKKNKDVFNHKIEVDRSGEYSIRLWFQKYDDSLGEPFTKENESVNYSLNWNQERVFSGTITNPNSSYAQTYKIEATYEYGSVIGEKTVLCEFYSWDPNTDEEELVSEIYISAKDRK